VIVDVSRNGQDEHEECHSKSLRQALVFVIEEEGPSIKVDKDVLPELLTARRFFGSLEGSHVQQNVLEVKRKRSQHARKNGTCSRGNFLDMPTAV
jgi:hypothetical protein